MGVGPGSAADLGCVVVAVGDAVVDVDLGVDVGAVHANRYVVVLCVLVTGRPSRTWLGGFGLERVHFTLKAPVAVWQPPALANLLCT